jgi:hypothetical protein
MKWDGKKVLTALKLYEASSSFQNQSLALMVELTRLITPRVIKCMNPKVTMFENDFVRDGDQFHLGSHHRAHSYL